MHEAAVAENLLQSIIAASAEHSDKKIVRIVMSCGQINAINDEAMKFAFEAVAEDTICQGAILEIKHIPLKSQCRRCKLEFDFDFYSPHCSDCGSTDIAIGADAPLLLEEIEFEEGD
ncbi:MAG: hydrogenase maturation nickel metallochaperone HypA [Phycisphaerae bacterium]|jgi:hydrogenase nickel incorporation protein HypA/HybF